MADNYTTERGTTHRDAFHTSTEFPSHGPCFWFFRAVKWIPVLFIVAVISWSYYAYVVQLCFRKFTFISLKFDNEPGVQPTRLIRFPTFFAVSVETVIEQVLFLIFYHIVFTMFIWSYWQTVFTTIGRVPTKVSAKFPHFVITNQAVIAVICSIFEF